MAKDGVPESICINSVYLSKNNTPFILYSIFFPVLINMVFFTVKRFKKPKKVIVNYVATENTENITVDVREKMIIHFSHIVFHPERQTQFIFFQSNTLALLSVERDNPHHAQVQKVHALKSPQQFVHSLHLLRLKDF